MQLFLQIASNKWEQKHLTPINNDHTNVIKVWEDYTEFDTEVNTKSKERQQLVC